MQSLEERLETEERARQLHLYRTVLKLKMLLFCFQPRAAWNSASLTSPLNRRTRWSCAVSQRYSTAQLSMTEKLQTCSGCVMMSSSTSTEKPAGTNYFELSRCHLSFLYTPGQSEVDVFISDFIFVRY